MVLFCFVWFLKYAQNRHAHTHTHTVGVWVKHTLPLHINSVLSDVFACWALMILNSAIQREQMTLISPIWISFINKKFWSFLKKDSPSFTDECESDMGLRLSSPFQQITIQKQILGNCVHIWSIHGGISISVLNRFRSFNVLRRPKHTVQKYTLHTTSYEYEWDHIGFSVTSRNFRRWLEAVVYRSRFNFQLFKVTPDSELESLPSLVVAWFQGLVVH